MRKVAIPIVFILFLSAATPVFAASSFSFGNVGSWLRTFVGRTGNTPIGLDGPVQRKITPYIYPTTRAIPIKGVGGPTSHPTQGTTQNNSQTNMVKNVVGNIPDTYQKRLNQYSDFLTKVKSRRDKLAAAGQDVTKLDQFITTATDNLNSANTVLQTEKTTLGNLDPNQDPTQLKKTVKEQLTVVRQSLTAVNSSMSDTVQEIVAVSGGSTTPAASATQENFQRVNGGGNQQHLPPGPANRK